MGGPRAAARLQRRNRKPQIALASYGFRDTPNRPAAAFLTDEQYTHKLGDLWQARGTRRYELDDIMLLKVGRHLRPRPHLKLIVGGDEGENKFLSGYRSRYTCLHAVSHEGPLTLVDGSADAGDLELAARLTARFGQGRDAAAVTVEVRHCRGGTETLTVPPLPQDSIPAEWYL